MSDPDDERITHVFDQTNGVIPSGGDEADGALSGRTASGVEDETGAPGAVSTTAPEHRRAGSDDDAGEAAPSGGPATGAATASPSVDVQSSTVVDDHADATPHRAAPTAAAPGPDPRDADSDPDGEHTFAVDSAGAATETDGATYSGAPEVAAWSAADDGRDEGRTRGESSAEPVDDASHTGRLADAYATGPAREVDDRATEGSGSRTVAAYAAGPSSEASGSSTTDAEAADAEAAGTGAAGTGAAGTATAPLDASGTGAREADESPTTGSESAGLPAAALDDDSIGHVFDQTNGVIEAIDGESDGTAASDTSSAGDREAER